MEVRGQRALQHHGKPSRGCEVAHKLPEQRWKSDETESRNEILTRRKVQQLRVRLEILVTFEALSYLSG